MFIIIWKYQVKVESIEEFEAIYASNGTWAELFKESQGYLGTEFLQDEANPQIYLTIDRWASKENYDEFLSHWQEEYKSLDAKCAGLTELETLLGRWNLK